MARIVKHPDVRRGDILDAAQGLFLARGYDATTIADVIAAAGVSKGGFYHHFASKEALIEALAERLAREAAAGVVDVLDDPAHNAFDKLHAFITHGRRLKTDEAATLWAVFGTIYRPDNIVLYHRIQAAATAVMTPILARLIAEGVADKTFDTPDPEGTAEQLLALGMTTYTTVARLLQAETDAEAREAVETLMHKLRLQGIAADRLLGLPDGSLVFVDEDVADMLLAARPHPGAADERKRG